MPSRSLLRSFFIAGFECSTHRLRSGKRLDLIAATEHDRYQRLDYQRMIALGIRTAREGLRWHLIESSPGKYDFASAIPMIRTARDLGVQVIWDLFHYGWPDDIDIFGPEFIERFGRFAGAFARLYKDESADPLLFCPINEPSFIAWAAGDVAYLNPFCRGRGDELKWQLIRAAIAAIEAIRSQLPDARVVGIDPVIHIVPATTDPAECEQVAGYNQAQFDAWSMLTGRMRPELGGREEFLDIIGVNFYPKNQWINHGRTIQRHEPLYRPFREILAEVWDRFRRPIIISETGTEDADRAPWFRYVADECWAARQAGVPIEGLCLYPILNHPGWDDDRHCHNGLWDYPNERGEREIYEPLARELRVQIRRFEEEEMSQQAPTLTLLDGREDLVCLSHLRWGFVFQRPQHLMSRFARERRVFFVEEPVFEPGEPHYKVFNDETGVHIICPYLPPGLSEEQQNQALEALLEDMVDEFRIARFILWYYTPMALAFSRKLNPALVVFDCMDELSGFKGAPQRLKDFEVELLQRADLVFTGGYSLYEVRKHRHPAVYCFPSSIDAAHFKSARNGVSDPTDQATIPRPRIGYCGVIDERLDLQLLRRCADLRPDWQWIMLGPVVKIDPAELPQASNIHYLGGKSYKELPQYLGNWDAAMLPFAHNQATRFISPTKTPEYLAAGLPAVSTSIRDVVRAWGQDGLVEIADAPEDFIAAIERSLPRRCDPRWLEAVDARLAHTSWDQTWNDMKQLMQLKLKRSPGAQAGGAPAQLISATSNSL